MGNGQSLKGQDAIRAADELASLFRPLRAALSRRAVEIVLGIAVLITMLACFSFIGAVQDDRAISRNLGTAQAEVLDGSGFARTLIRFTVANGEVWVPERGVYYPRGLQPGSTVAVEYDLTAPEQVRVAGRSAVSGLLPLLGVTLGSWLVLGPLVLRMRRRRSQHRGA